MQAQVFDAITEQQFAALQKQAAQAAGMTLKGNEGTAEARGVRMRWSYDPESGRLELQCLKKPFLVSDGYVETQIAKLVNQAVEQDATH